MPSTLVFPYFSLPLGSHSCICLHSIVENCCGRSITPAKSKPSRQLETVIHLSKSRFFGLLLVMVRIPFRPEFVHRGEFFQGIYIAHCTVSRPCCALPSRPSWWKRKSWFVSDRLRHARRTLLEATIFVKSAQAVRVTVEVNLNVNGIKSNLK